MKTVYSMARFMGLDYGEKTIGVAISDTLNITAQSLEVIKRPNEQSIKKSILRLKEIINEFDICEIVLGYPKNMDNTEGIRCVKTEEFKQRLHRNFKKIPVTLWDERLSTVAVQRGLLDDGLKRNKRKKVVDKLAATFILQGYLDSKANNKILKEH